MKSTLGQEHRIQEATEFFRWLDETDATIIVPTPIITELLMGATAEESHQILAALDRSFRVAEFDTLSAKHAAEVWRFKKSVKVIDDLVQSGVSMRTKLKIDIQILGIAMAANASQLYTEDEDFAKLAYGFIPVRKMPVQIQGDLFRSSAGTASPESSPDTSPSPGPDSPPGAV